MTTRPSPGTPQYRALALLETMPPGTEVTTAQWAECMGEPPANVRHYFEQLLEAGLVSMRQKNQHQRAPMFWTLNAAAQCKPAANPPPQRESAVAAAPYLIDGDPTCRWPKCKCMSVCEAHHTLIPDQRRGGVEGHAGAAPPLAGIESGPRHPTGLRLALKLEIEREGQSHLLTLEEAHQLTKDGEAVGEFLRRHLREAV